MGVARRAEPGGISGLVALIERDGEAIDADLQREYGLSLGDVVSGRVTFRRLLTLMDGLPLDGTAVWRKRVRESAGKASGKHAPPPAEWWTPERDLLAMIADGQAMRMWQAGGNKGPKPRPIRRPGVSSATHSTDMPQEQVRAALDAIGPRSRAVAVDDPADDPQQPERGPNGADDDSGNGEAAAG